VGDLAGVSVIPAKAGIQLLGLTEAAG